MSAQNNNSNNNSNEINHRLNDSKSAFSMNEQEQVPPSFAELTQVPVFRSVTGVASYACNFSLAPPSLYSSCSPPFVSSKSDNSFSGAAHKMDLWTTSGDIGTVPMYEEPLDMRVLSHSVDTTQLDNNFAPVPEVPSYVEKYTSFTSRQFPNQILRHLVEVFGGHSSLDFEMNAALYQINGVVYQSHASAAFRVNIFKKEKQYLVEFQRRTGDSMVFNNFFHFVKSKSANLMSDQSANGAQEPARFVPPAYDVILDADSLGPLQAMAESTYVDVAREGMKMLAKCSAAPDNHKVLVRMLPVLAKHLVSKDEELARYTAYILAQISKTNDICSLIASKDWLSLVFSQLAQLENRETCRQLAQVTSNVCQLDSEALNGNQGFVEILKKLQSSRDGRLQSLVEATLARLDV